MRLIRAPGRPLTCVTIRFTRRGEQAHRIGSDAISESSDRSGTATANDSSAIERFVAEWLGGLIDYDAIHGTQLVLTLSKYLDCGGNYDASALALSVHRSTLKYRLRRIREVSGHDIGHPDVQFNLQVATRAWRTLQALRLS